MRNTELLNNIDAAIAEKNLLKHPFYQDWQAGKLSRESLQLYAAQYYRHVEAFPKHLRVLAARTEGPLREIVLENLAEEENPAATHPKLWRDFAAALGLNEDDLCYCPSLPGTQAVVETFREIVGDRPVSESVAALYAYESQVPEIATTKIEGLKKFYGIDKPQGLAYFTVHEQADREHRAAWRNWLEEHGSGNEAEILATTNEALDALWGALDAVHCTHA
jgi:pyrroloquinoline-quinone synthase